MYRLNFVAFGVTLAINVGCQVPTPTEACNSSLAHTVPTEGHDDTAHRIEAVLRSWKGSGPGCVAEVIAGGNVLVSDARGFACLEHRASLGVATPIYVGSIAKQFIAATALLLEQEGTVDLDADIRACIPELPDYGHALTGRHLLAHTSGLRDYLQVLHHGGSGRWDYHSREDVLRVICRQNALNHLPGNEASYTNSGYVLLSLMLERATGETLADLSHRLLFEPLGMTQTQFLLTGREVIPNRARAYREIRGGGYELYEPIHPAGGLITSAVDLRRWAGNLRDPLVGGAALVTDLTTPTRLRTGEVTKEGAGLRITTRFGRTVVEHNGSNRGFNAHFSWYPADDLFVIVLCNVRQARATARAHDLAEAALGIAAEEPADFPTLPSPTVAALAPYGGVYECRESNGRLEIEVDPPHGIVTLYLDHPGDSRTGSHVLKPTGIQSEFTLHRFPGAARLAVSTNTAGHRRVKLEVDGRPELVYQEVSALKADLEALCGTYTSPDLGATYTIAAEGGRIDVTILRPDGRSVARGELKAVSRDFFVFAEDSLTSLRILPNKESAPSDLELNEPRVRGVRLQKNR